MTPGTPGVSSPASHVTARCLSVKIGICDRRGLVDSTPAADEGRPAVSSLPRLTPSTRVQNTSTAFVYKVSSKHTGDLLPEVPPGVEPLALSVYRVVPMLPDGQNAVHSHLRGGAGLVSGQRHSSTELITHDSSLLPSEAWGSQRGHIQTLRPTLTSLPPRQSASAIEPQSRAPYLAAKPVPRRSRSSQPGVQAGRKAHRIRHIMIWRCVRRGPGSSSEPPEPPISFSLAWCFK
jgi:hypothetical protein